MYHHLRGRIVELGPTRVVVETGGVGYELTVPLSTYEHLKSQSPEQPVLVYTHLYVREDQMKLFGFSSPDERSCFLAILSVSGVGPTTAIALLSGLQASELLEAVREGAAAKLQRIKGIGRKTADRLVLELGGRLPKALLEDRGARGEDELEMALVSLGYSPSQAASASRSARTTSPRGTLEDLIKIALRSGR